MKPKLEPLPHEARSQITARRESLGLTQAQAASAAGLAVTTWNSVEVGKSAGSGLTRAAMCRALRWAPESINELERGRTAVETADVSTDPATWGASYEKLAAQVSGLQSEVSELEAELRETLPTRPAAARGVDLSGLPEQDVELIVSQVRRLRRLNGLPEDPHVRGPRVGPVGHISAPGVALTHR